MVHSSIDELGEVLDDIEKSGVNVRLYESDDKAYGFASQLQNAARTVIFRMDRFSKQDFERAAPLLDKCSVLTQGTPLEEPMRERYIELTRKARLAA